VYANRLSESEVFWRDHSPWLREHGYVLRQRCQPNWVPSRKNKAWVFYKFEDKIRPLVRELTNARHGLIGAQGARVLDAISTSDNLPVVFEKKEPHSTVSGFARTSNSR
ncbi:hypothetical protein FB451DRAFT_1071317, partial [Mycena latifolia]